MIFKSAEEVFEHIKSKDFENLLNTINLVKPLDIEYLLTNYKANNPNLKELQEIWFKSLNDDKPDYSVYSKDDYINEAFYCWKTYSRRYLLMLKKYLQEENCEIELNDISNVLDLGCGIGYTTVSLYNIFDKANITGTNVKDSTQFLVDTIACENFDDRIKIVDEADTLYLDKIDLVFASEFFEHLDHPIDLLISLIAIYKPKYFIIANTFTQPAIGYFKTYYFNNKAYSGRDISKLFNNILRANDYQKVDAGFWNNRPTIWKLSNVRKNNLL